MDSTAESLLAAQARAESLFDAVVASGVMRAGILESSASGDLEVHIHADPHLSQDQKQALLQIYRSFVGEAPTDVEGMADGVDPAEADGR